MIMASTKPANKTNDASQATIIETKRELENVEEALSQFPDLLSQSPDLLGGAEVQQLLQRLTDASGVAEDVESKLDDVLAKLDGLLDALGIDPESLGNLEEQPSASPIRKSMSTISALFNSVVLRNITKETYMLQKTTLLIFDCDASAWVSYAAALATRDNKDTYDLRIATWNVWEDERWNHLRHPFILETLLLSQNQYSVIMLQEVTTPLFKLMLQHPAARSDWIITDLMEQFELCPNFYSTVIMLKRTIALDFDIYAGLLEYENTRMQKSLNIVELSLDSKPQLRFCTSHFESHPEDVRKRREQFHTAALVATAPISIHNEAYEDSLWALPIPLTTIFPSIPAIITGDCNIKSYDELDSFLLPPFCFVDGFLAANPSTEPPYRAHPTYGLNVNVKRISPFKKPVCRLDYIFLRGSNLDIVKEEKSSGNIGDLPVCPIETASDATGRDGLIWASDHLGHWLSVRWDTRVPAEKVPP
ncbi:hypothetical protein CVT24_001791 [Panaeolus cyanescens]|uniref:Endonuclease/exonuclease/phosphatase domain-containing protein n=1 Tax=Panaeolus cyanescens TaxID=181874 RepID=A0A409YUB3_9AGAR|nr:hypothetical protein CVT24_001791 [Panaeolus cyanescens]